MVKSCEPKLLTRRAIQSARDETKLKANNAGALGVFFPQYL